jgi:hypothetical protein
VTTIEIVTLPPTTLTVTQTSPLTGAVETLNTVSELSINEPGTQGTKGDAGPGVPTGGITGYILAKASNADYDTQWIIAPSGGGGTSDYNLLSNKPDLSGYITGPASATDNAIVRFDATTGKLTQDSLVTIDDAGGLYVTNAGIQFGTDVNLYRQTNNELRTSDTFSATGNIVIAGATTGFLARAATATTTQTFGTRVSTDTVDRYTITADGKNSWGPGNGAVDTNLYRFAADVLTTDDSFLITNPVAGQIPLTVKHAASPSVDFTQWQGSTGTVVAALGSTGRMRVIGLHNPAQTGPQLNMNSSNVQVSAGSASDNLFQVKGATSQTGDLQQWQDVNAVVLARVSSAGAITAVGVTSTNVLVSTRTGLTNNVIATGLNTDTIGHYVVTADGKNWWGDGTSALDTNIYRFAADSLVTDDTFTSIRASSGNAALQVQVTGDATPRLRINASGNINWSNGTLASDTDLYRIAAGTLGTTSTFRIDKTASTDNAISYRQSGDAVARFSMNAAGLMAWSDGTNSTDTNLYRNSAGVLKTDSSFSAVSMTISSTLSFTGTTNTGFVARNLAAAGTIWTATRIGSDTADRFNIDATGKHQWSDGASAFDTNLYRSAADTLKTDDNFIIGSPGTVAGSAVTIDGAQTLTNKSIAATQLTGTIATARLGTGTADSTTILYGDNVWRTAPSGGGGGTTFVAPRVQTSADATSISVSVDSYDKVKQTNTQSAGTLTINNPTGTPVAMQELTYRIKTQNVQTYAFGSAFRGSLDTPLPTTTFGSNLIEYVKFMWNSDDSKWDLVSLAGGY